MEMANGKRGPEEDADDPTSAKKVGPAFYLIQATVSSSIAITPPNLLMTHVHSARRHDLTILTALTWLL